MKRGQNLVKWIAHYYGRTQSFLWFQQKSVIYNNYRFPRLKELIIHGGPLGPVSRRGLVKVATRLKFLTAPASDGQVYRHFEVLLVIIDYLQKTNHLNKVELAI